MDCPRSDQALIPSRTAFVGILAPILLVLSLALAGPASASNDFRSGAQSIKSGQNKFDDNDGATLQANEFRGHPRAGTPFAKSCKFNYGATVWYKIRARKYGTLRVSSVGGAESTGNGDGYLDTNLALFRGSSVSRPVACNDEDPHGSGLDAAVKRFVAPGRYGVQVGGLLYKCCGYEEGDFNLEADFSRAPVVNARPRWKFEPHGHKTEFDLRLKAERRSKARVRCSGDCNGIKRRCKGGCVLAKNELVTTGTKIKIYVRKPHKYGRLFTFRFRAPSHGPALRSRKLRPRGG